MAQFGAPNFLNVIDAYEAGSRQRERSRLADLAEQGRMLQGQALQGDTNALAKLGQVSPERYMQTKQFTADQKQQFVKDFASAAYDADTPEKWNAVVQRFKAQGHTFDPGEDAFENRESLINQVVGIGDRMGMDLRRQEAAADQAWKEKTFTADQAFKDRSLTQDQQQHEDTLALGRDKLAAEAGKEMRPDLKDITSIRKEIGDLPSYKTYSSALPVYNSMTKAADTRAGDLNLVYGLAKIYDPTSVVRESEQVLVQNTANLPDWLVGQINRLNGGGGLRPDTRKAVMDEARNRMDAYKSAYESNLGQYRGFARRHKIDEADIIPQMDSIADYVPPGQQGAGKTKSGLKFEVQP